MKTLLALLFGSFILAIGSMSPAAAAQNSSPLKCLVVDSVNKSLVIDVCKCVSKVSVPADVLKRLRPNPLRVVSMCPFINNGGGGGVETVSDNPPDDHHHGHGFSFSKADSSSGVISLGIVVGRVPAAGTAQDQHNQSLALGDGGANALSGTSGNAGASIVTTSTTTIQPFATGGYAPLAGKQGGSSSNTSTSSDGSTSGSTCAGSQC